MSLLRIAGLIVSLTLFAFVLVAKRGRRISNQDALLALFMAAGLLLVSLFPDAFNTVLGWFSFNKGGGGRLIGLLIFSNFLLFLLYLRTRAGIAENQQTLNRLVQAMAQAEFRRQYGQEGGAPIAVIIPAYNEAENIGNVLQRLPQQVGGLDVDAIVVVDGATDDTTDVVRQSQAAAVTHIINRGGGAALKAGYELALERGAEIIVSLDADGQHLPEEIPLLVAPILDDQADLVNGSRVLGSYEKESEVRALGVVLFNWLISALTLTHITDCSNAFRAIRAGDLARLDLRQTQYHSTEMLIEAFKKGLRVIEVPITVRRRASGESKKGPTVRYALGFTRAIFSTWLR
ncbi:MAG: DUF2304 family protein [Chloroflexota bacterium]|nr:DUF2304 family protein [Chloroflexota bacterium]